MDNTAFSTVPFSELSASDRATVFMHQIGDGIKGRAVVGVAKLYGMISFFWLSLGNQSALLSKCCWVCSSR